MQHRLMLHAASLKLHAVSFEAACSFNEAARSFKRSCMQLQTKLRAASNKAARSFRRRRREAKMNLILQVRKAGVETALETHFTTKKFLV